MKSSIITLNEPFDESKCLGPPSKLVLTTNQVQYLQVIESPNQEIWRRNWGGFSQGKKRPIPDLELESRTRPQIPQFIRSTTFSRLYL